MVAVKHSMKIIRQQRRWRWGALWLLGAALWGGRSVAVTPPDQPIITSLSVAGTNLVFNASISPDVDQAILEMRATVDAAWQEAAMLDVPSGGGNVEFTILRPALDAAFFRLKATTHATTNAQLSAELQYVTIPPLGSDGTNALSGTDAVFHFKGVVDGSDRILVTREGAFWEHVNWDWPAGAVTINDAQWNPREKNYLTTTGAVTFLPERYSLEDVGLEVIEGRDVIALERTNCALIVYLDDTPLGAAMYEFKIHFHPATIKPAKTGTSPAATLKIAAQIDGSDSLKITAREAVWEHRAYSYPGAVSLNDIPWDVGQTNVLMNVGTNTFLPPGVDLSTARIVNRKGRDVGTMWAEADALWIQFADNPNGADVYELELSFGR
jgi:hypothetical protein